ncbi:MAG: hypothetical protein KGL39_04375 [Patescibacteria group bacterium]|nr:hypothetical protein [Patescibacteria group bacterium]
MSGPYIPTALSTPIVNPSIATVGAQALPYISVSYYQFAPTAMEVKTLVPGGTTAQSMESLALTINRATQWANSYLFGKAASSKGGTLAASLSIEKVKTRVKKGELRLVCDYSPIQQVIGIDAGLNPSSLSSIGSGLAAGVEIGNWVITVPMSYVPIRSGDTGTPMVYGGITGDVYVVWSYVHGYPHTKLTASVLEGATSCTVEATDGAGGVWGVPWVPYLTVFDGQQTETVTVNSVTTGSSTTTFNTSAFAYAHTVPTAPDFLPVTAVPDDVLQAVTSLTTMLIKTRGSKAMVMPQMPGEKPSRSALAQAGALDDWEIAERLLQPYRSHTKSKV